MTPYEKALGDSAKEKLSQFSGRTGFRERWPSAASGKQRGEENKAKNLLWETARWNTKDWIKSGV